MYNSLKLKGWLPMGSRCLTVADVNAACTLIFKHERFAVFFFCLL